MRILHRWSFLSALLVLALFFASSPARASHEAGAKIWWCGGGGNQIVFHVAIAYNNFDRHSLGDSTIETFDFGDGTSAQIGVTATELHPGAGNGWYLGEATISHTYAFGSGVVAAGLETCCRSSGLLGSPDLNNRRFGTLRAKVEVDPAFSALCPSQVIHPVYFLWLPGKPGSAIEIPLGINDHDPFRCRFADDVEAGGGPNPAGMTIDPDTCQITWTPSGDPAKMWTTQVQVERESGGSLVGSSLFDFQVGLDAARPVCRIDHLDPGPPARLHVLVQDAPAGIAEISVVQSQNTTVAVPPFSPGAVDPLTVVATKSDEAHGSAFTLQVDDMAGNRTVCDPILTDEARAFGKPVSHAYPGIPPAEHVVTVANGDPGLQELSLEVNHHRFRMAGLRPDETRTLDVAAAVTPGVNSTFVLTSHGRPGGHAAVLIWDGGEP